VAVKKAELFTREKITDANRRTVKRAEREKWISIIERRVQDKLMELKEEVGQGALAMWPSAFEGTRRLFDVLKDQEDNLGRFMIERIEASSIENPRGNKDPQVKLTSTFVFMDENGLGAYERFRAHLTDKGWTVTTKGKIEKLATGGIKARLEIFIPFPGVKS